MSKRTRSLLSSLLLATAGLQAAPDPWDTYSDTWVATDGLGRALPDASACGAPRAGKFVGVFYFLWLEGKGPVYDLSKLLADNPANPAYGPVHAFHFWGQPLLGYYRSDDEFVIRKHAQMLGDAGVDVLFFDVTNALTYDATYLAVCRVLEDIRRLGQRTPQIAFLAHSRSERVVQHLYDTFYAKGLHPDLWFRWLGKPLILSSTNGLTAPVTDFFTFRESWAWTTGHKWFGDGRDKWPWLDHTPQQPGWHESPQKPEQIAVAVAEHPTSNIGRSHHGGRQPRPGQTASEKGIYFAEQWERALQIDPPFVFVTGWNEWIAQRFLKEAGKPPGLMTGRPLKPGDTFFVDQFDQEFSRDIEPMQGGHGDAYYYQFVNFIRRFKGVRPLPAVVSRSIQIDGQFDDWRPVAPEFRDNVGDVAHRDHAGWKGQPRFVNRTGRNDIVAAKVSASGPQVCFYVRTRAPLTPPTDPNWMRLLLDTDCDPKTGWMGYDLIVNRVAPDGGEALVERRAGAQWQPVRRAIFRMAGSELELAVPRELLRLPDAKAAFDFKWADNIALTGDASDFTLFGDAAPNDRFSFRARFEAAAGGGANTKP